MRWRHRDFGGYIQLRLDRMQILQATGWFAPATMAVAQGERSVCNKDEDALSMAVEAARDCLRGADRGSVDAVYLCSTTLPYADRQNAGILKTVLDLRDDVVTADFTASQKAGTTALVTALDVLAGGGKKRVLVTAADKRETKGAYFYEMWFGDGAASLLPAPRGSSRVRRIALCEPRLRRPLPRVRTYAADYMWEERWVRYEGYSKIIPEAVNGLLKKPGMTMDGVTKLCFPCFFKAEQMAIAKALGAAGKVADNMHEVCGETGVAHPFVMLVKALEEASPGDMILLAGFGQGCDALLFKVTDEIKKLPARRDRRLLGDRECRCSTTRSTASSAGSSTSRWGSAPRRAARR